MIYRHVTYKRLVIAILDTSNSKIVVILTATHNVKVAIVVITYINIIYDVIGVSLVIKERAIDLDIGRRGRLSFHQLRFEALTQILILFADAIISLSEWICIALCGSCRLDKTFREIESKREVCQVVVCQGCWKCTHKRIIINWCLIIGGTCYIGV